jgi:uncharacterized protein YukE
MTFQHPNAVPIIDNSDLDISGDEHSSHLIGDEAINTAVAHTIPGYEEKLGFKLETSAHERHTRLGGLAFAKIEKDIARLNGLASAIENISSVVKAGKEQLAQDWAGESYDAFRANIENLENLEKTLNDYKAAVGTTAAGLETALSGIRTGYEKYRGHCLGNHFNWSKFRLSPPDHWSRMTTDSGEYLAENCTSVHMMADCLYNEDGLVEIIDGKLTTKELFDETLVKWDCTQDLAIATSQYQWVVKAADEQRGAIHQKIDEYCTEADDLRAFVTNAYDVSLDNLRIVAEANVFSHLSVTGGSAPAAGGDPGQGSPSDGSPGGAPGGGSPGGGGAEVMMPPPLPNPAPEPVRAAVPEATDPATAGQAESVQIKDGDRTISVTSPDGEGHVKVTVAGADGQAKAYDLDFDAASGQEPRPAAGPDGRPLADGASPGQPHAERVPAGTNGKCVIQDGPLTITAERPLFDPRTLKIEVDDGVNEPTTYTVDFDEADTSGTTSPPANAQQADSPVAGAPETAGSGGPGSGGPGADGSGAGEPDSDRPGVGGPGVTGPGAGGPGANALGADGPGAEAPNAGGPGTAGPGSEGAADGQDEQTADGSATQAPAVEPVGQGDDAKQAEQLTTTQAWTGEPGDEVAESFVPDQANGEAELSSAADGEPAGAAGGAMPLMAGAGGAVEGGRAGSGWSVHGDLFDNGDPVYSMHGVLGEDDRQGK